MATVDAIDDPRELADLRHRRAVRRRQAWVILALALLAVGYLAWRVGAHLIASAGLRMNHYQVHWDVDRETWRQGGVTAVKAGPFPFFSDSRPNTDLKCLPWLHRVEGLDLALATGLGDADLAGLDRLTDLRSLNLDRTGGQQWRYDPGRLTDATLARIRPLVRLRELSLGGQKITDDGLANLSGLVRLESLDLKGDAITDAGLEHLVRLPSLKSVDLQRTRVTAGGVRGFEAARPGVLVLFDPPSPSPR
jgi:hypothetical protein